MTLSPEIQKIIEDKAVRYDIPAWLIAAIIQTESGGDPWAMRFEPGFLKKYVPEKTSQRFGASMETERVMRGTSFGLMQIMGQVAREFGCNFPFLSELCLPDNGIEFGCRKLKSLTGLHFVKLGWPGVVAAYNAGSPRYTPHPHPNPLPEGEGENRKFVNQAYVDKVIAAGIKFKEGKDV